MNEVEVSQEGWAYTLLTVEVPKVKPVYRAGRQTDLPDLISTQVIASRDPRLSPGLPTSSIYSRDFLLEEDWREDGDEDEDTGSFHSEDWYCQDVGDSFEEEARNLKVRIHINPKFFPNLSGAPGNASDEPEPRTEPTESPNLPQKADKAASASSQSKTSSEPKSEVSRMPSYQGKMPEWMKEYIEETRISKEASKEKVVEGKTPPSAVSPARKEEKKSKPEIERQSSSGKSEEKVNQASVSDEIIPVILHTSPRNTRDRQDDPKLSPSTQDGKAYSEKIQAWMEATQEFLDEGKKGSGSSKGSKEEYCTSDGRRKRSRSRSSSRRRYPARDAIQSDKPSIMEEGPETASPKHLESDIPESVLESKPEAHRNRRDKSSKVLDKEKEEKEEEILLDPRVPDMYRAEMEEKIQEERRKKREARHKVKTPSETKLDAQKLCQKGTDVEQENSAIREETEPPVKKQAIKRSEGKHGYKPKSPPREIEIRNIERNFPQPPNKTDSIHSGLSDDDNKASGGNKQEYHHLSGVRLDISRRPSADTIQSPPVHHSTPRAVPKIPDNPDMEIRRVSTRAWSPPSAREASRRFVGPDSDLPVEQPREERTVRLHAVKRPNKETQVQPNMGRNIPKVMDIPLEDETKRQRVPRHHGQSTNRPQSADEQKLQMQYSSEHEGKSVKDRNLPVTKEPEPCTDKVSRGPILRTVSYEDIEDDEDFIMDANIPGYRSSDLQSGERNIQKSKDKESMMIYDNDRRSERSSRRIDPPEIKQRTKRHEPYDFKKSTERVDTEHLRDPLPPDKPDQNWRGRQRGPEYTHSSRNTTNSSHNVREKAKHRSPPRQRTFKPMSKYLTKVFMDHCDSEDSQKRPVIDAVITRQTENTVRELENVYRGIQPSTVLGEPFKHLSPLSLNTELESTFIECPVVKRTYLQELKEWMTKKPLEEYMMGRLNKLSRKPTDIPMSGKTDMTVKECMEAFDAEVYTLVKGKNSVDSENVFPCPSNSTEETTDQVFRQVTKYMDFLVSKSFLVEKDQDRMSSQQLERTELDHRLAPAGTRKRAALDDRTNIGEIQSTKKRHAVDARSHVQQSVAKPALRSDSHDWESHSRVSEVSRDLPEEAVLPRKRFTDEAFSPPRELSRRPGFLDRMEAIMTDRDNITKAPVAKTIPLEPDVLPHFDDRYTRNRSFRSASAYDFNQDEILKINISGSNDEGQSYNTEGQPDEISAPATRSQREQDPDAANIENKLRITRTELGATESAGKDAVSSSKSQLETTSPAMYSPTQPTGPEDLMEYVEAEKQNKGRKDVKDDSPKKRKAKDADTGSSKKKKKDKDKARDDDKKEDKKKKEKKDKKKDKDRKKKHSEKSKEDADGQSEDDEKSKHKTEKEQSKGKNTQHTDRVSDHRDYRKDREKDEKLSTEKEHKKERFERDKRAKDEGRSSARDGRRDKVEKSEKRNDERYREQRAHRSEKEEEKKQKQQDKAGSHHQDGEVIPQASGTELAAQSLTSHSQGPDPSVSHHDPAKLSGIFLQYFIKSNEEVFKQFGDICPDVNTFQSAIVEPENSFLWALALAVHEKHKEMEPERDQHNTGHMEVCTATAADKGDISASAMTETTGNISASDYEKMMNEYGSLPEGVSLEMNEYGSYQVKVQLPEDKETGEISPDEFRSDEADMGKGKKKGSSRLLQAFRQQVEAKKRTTSSGKEDKQKHIAKLSAEKAAMKPAPKSAKPLFIPPTLFKPGDSTHGKDELIASKLGLSMANSHQTDDIIKNAFDIFAEKARDLLKEKFNKEVLDELSKGAQSLLSISASKMKHFGSLSALAFSIYQQYQRDPMNGEVRQEGEKSAPTTEDRDTQKQTISEAVSKSKKPRTDSRKKAVDVEESHATHMEDRSKITREIMDGHEKLDFERDKSQKDLSRLKKIGRPSYLFSARIEKLVSEQKNKEEKHEKLEENVGHVEELEAEQESGSVVEEHASCANKPDKESVQSTSCANKPDKESVQSPTGLVQAKFNPAFSPADIAPDVAENVIGEPTSPGEGAVDVGMETSGDSKKVSMTLPKGNKLMMAFRQAMLAKKKAKKESFRPGVESVTTSKSGIKVLHQFGIKPRVVTPTPDQTLSASSTQTIVSVTNIVSVASTSGTTNVTASLPPHSFSSTWPTTMPPTQEPQTLPLLPESTLVPDIISQEAEPNPVVHSSSETLAAVTVAADTVSPSIVSADMISTDSVSGMISADLVSTGMVSASTHTADTGSCGTVSGMVSAGEVSTGTISTGTVSAGTDPVEPVLVTAPAISAETDQISDTNSTSIPSSAVISAPPVMSVPPPLPASSAEPSRALLPTPTAEKTPAPGFHKTGSPLLPTPHRRTLLPTPGTVPTGLLPTPTYGHPPGLLPTPGQPPLPPSSYDSSSEAQPPPYPSSYHQPPLPDYSEPPPPFPFTSSEKKSDDLSTIPLPLPEGSNLDKSVFDPAMMEQYQQKVKEFLERKKSGKKESTSSTSKQENTTQSYGWEQYYQSQTADSSGSSQSFDQWNNQWYEYWNNLQQQYSSSWGGWGDQWGQDYSAWSSSWQQWDQTTDVSKPPPIPGYDPSVGYDMSVPPPGYAWPDTTPAAPGTETTSQPELEEAAPGTESTPLLGAMEVAPGTETSAQLEALEVAPGTEEEHAIIMPFPRPMFPPNNLRFYVFNTERDSCKEAESFLLSTGAKLFDCINLDMLTAVQFPLVKYLVLVHTEDLKSIHKIPNLCKLREEPKVEFATFTSASDIREKKQQLIMLHGGILLPDDGTLMGVAPHSLELLMDYMMSEKKHGRSWCLKVPKHIFKEIDKMRAGHGETSLDYQRLVQLTQVLQRYEDRGVVETLQEDQCSDKPRPAQEYLACCVQLQAHCCRRHRHCYLFTDKTQKQESMDMFKANGINVMSLSTFLETIAHKPAAAVIPVPSVYHSLQESAAFNDAALSSGTKSLQVDLPAARKMPITGSVLEDVPAEPRPPGEEDLPLTFTRTTQPVDRGTSELSGSLPMSTATSMGGQLHLQGLDDIEEVDMEVT